MKALERKKELILRRELSFTNAIGAAVFEKPKVSFWMVLIPILFVYFMYRMQKYKSGRLKFDQEFMLIRRKAMDLAIEAVETGVAASSIDEAVREAGLSDALEKPYASWLRALIDYYIDLLSADGDSFESLVRSAYRNRAGFLLILNRLSAAEKEFYTLLRPQLAATEGAFEIIAAIEKHSQRLRRELAENTFA